MKTLDTLCAEKEIDRLHYLIYRVFHEDKLGSELLESLKNKVFGENINSKNSTITEKCLLKEGKSILIKEIALAIISVRGRLDSE